jgi:hypothetical protein
MRWASTITVAAAFVTIVSTAEADVFTFANDPFAGSTALTTPGRQIVGGEPFINFNILEDVFRIDADTFSVSAPVAFANDIAANLAVSGLNVIVLRDLGPPMNAGLAADLIAARITSPGAGFFIYFNSGLNTPRLVFSTDLNDNTADLKIVARLINLNGNSAAMSQFTADNFEITDVPEPGSVLLLSVAGSLWGLRAARRRRHARTD